MMKLEFASCRSGFSDCKLPSFYRDYNFYFRLQWIPPRNCRACRRSHFTPLWTCQTQTQNTLSEQVRLRGRKSLETLDRAVLLTKQSYFACLVSAAGSDDSTRLDRSRGKVWLSKRFPLVSKQKHYEISPMSNVYHAQQTQTGNNGNFASWQQPRATQSS